mmetsp:Transcript_5381/g.14966  ORF Transcript_5381/g.14966 Transcript_5381/m.14966 type:complete len:303 (+) Transcript_5381:292-1200(+)|eukprot:CAMPEP_0117670276 /NCGR_PEP_ID=MMETSP0804-20121206/12647_1 /TAXON_ID=1074897 /ORGANISM="Tetraselmis astigmatica, Strain CCMP880" /LENGTH=302 /DNA_ID=CAMNT_0005478525 /DNA_START=278 /DNA_END=1186 /DNA_ORIENTATION=-
MISMISRLGNVGASGRRAGALTECLLRPPPHDASISVSPASIRWPQTSSIPAWFTDPNGDTLSARTNSGQPLLSIMAASPRCSGPSPVSRTGNTCVDDDDRGNISQPSSVLFDDDQPVPLFWLETPVRAGKRSRAIVDNQLSAPPNKAARLSAEPLPSSPRINSSPLHAHARRCEAKQARSNLATRGLSHNPCLVKEQTEKPTIERTLAGSSGQVVNDEQSEDEEEDGAAAAQAVLAAWEMDFIWPAEQVEPPAREGSCPIALHPTSAPAPQSTTCTYQWLPFPIWEEATGKEMAYPFRISC